MSFFIFTYFLGTQSDEFVFPLELRASMFSSQTDSFLRSFSRGPQKADPHSRVYNPPKDNAIIHYFVSTAQGGVKGEFKNFFTPAFHPPPQTSPRANPSPPPTPAPSPPSTRPPKPRKPLILLAIVGSVPNFWGMGNEERNRPLRGFATHGEANTPSEASAEGTG